jgi:hypothetical protein
MIIHSSILLILLEISLYLESSILGTRSMYFCLLLWNMALTLASGTVSNMIYIALVLAHKFPKKILFTESLQYMYLVFQHPLSSPSVEDSPSWPI